MCVVRRYKKISTGALSSPFGQRYIYIYIVVKYITPYGGLKSGARSIFLRRRRLLSFDGSLPPVPWISGKTHRAVSSLHRQRISYLQWSCEWLIGQQSKTADRLWILVLFWKERCLFSDKKTVDATCRSRLSPLRKVRFYSPAFRGKSRRKVELWEVKVDHLSIGVDLCSF